MLTSETASWKDLDITVFADCGAPEPGSVTAPILTGADLCLIVVNTDLDDPAHARRRIHELTDHAHRRAILLTGPSTASGRDFATALALPVLARLAWERGSVRALLRGTRPRYRRGTLLPAARAIAGTIEAQLRPPPAPFPTTADTDAQIRPARPTTRHRVPGRPVTRPRVYQIDPPAPAPPPARQARPEPNPSPHPMPRPGPTEADTGPHSGHRIRDPEITEPPRPAESPGTVPSGPPEPDTELTAPVVPDPPVAEPDLAAPAADPTGLDIESAAAALVAAAPEPVGPAVVSAEPVPVLSVQVFGPLRVVWRSAVDAAPVEITRSLRPRERDLLIVLAVHPHGAARDTVIEALWGEHPLRRPTNALNTVVSRLRTAIATATGGTITEIIEGDKSRYWLLPDLWGVDYRVFDTAVTALRTATGTEERARACRAILAAADGVLGEDFTGGDWIAPVREHARRDRLKALGKLAAMLVDTDPDQTLALLETALVNDPTNEPIYQDILRLHARLGERTAINPTLALLKRRLESIGDIPAQRTLDIARVLRDQHTSDRDIGPERRR
jgi:DNA-binding SARP family transcriptional activator